MIADTQGKTGILFLSPWTGFYGAEKNLYLLIKYLNREIFHPVVVLPDKGPLSERLQTLDVPVSLSPLRPWFEPNGSADAALRWLAGLPERVQRIIDVVHHWDIKIVHSNVADILEGAIAAKLTGRPHICTVQNNRFAYTWLKSFISVARVHETLSSLSHTIVPLSNAVKEALSPFVAPSKLRVIHAGIEMQSFQANPVHDLPDSVLHQAIGSWEPRICSIGRVEPQKGFDFLVDAAATVAAVYPGARFSVFGRIDSVFHYQRLLQQVNRLNLAENIRFEGHTDRVPEQLKASDLFVLSSREEGFGLVVAEAMLAGKPVVSTRCGGPEDIIVDGTTGYLVPPNDPGALADAILKVLEDPEHARQMGREGLKRVLQHFDVRTTTEQYEALYREVLDGEAARPTRDKDGEAVLIGAVLDTLEKYSGEFYEMSQFQDMKHFEARLKNTLAYKAYNASKNLFRFYSVWRYRFGVAWETVRGQPLSRWPGLLKNLWIGYQLGKRQQKNYPPRAEDED